MPVVPPVTRAILPSNFLLMRSPLILDTSVYYLTRHIRSAPFISALRSGGPPRTSRGHAVEGGDGHVAQRLCARAAFRHDLQPDDGRVEMTRRRARVQRGAYLALGLGILHERLQQRFEAG